MATTRKSKAETEDTVMQVNDTPTSDVDVQTLLSQMAEMQKQIETMKQSQPVPSVLESFKDRMITFINLTPGSAMLKGSANRPYEIEGRYKFRTFTETEARVIVSNMGNYLREGFVYIDDASFVREVGLADAYANMLKPEDLKELFNKNPQTIVSAYELALDGQKKIILDMVIEKKSKGQPIDANILVKLGELSGKDLVNIEADE